MCPDQESNWLPLTLRGHGQPTEPCQPGQGPYIHKISVTCLSVQVVCKKFCLSKQLDKYTKN